MKSRFDQFVKPWVSISSLAAKQLCYSEFFDSIIEIFLHFVYKIDKNILSVTLLGSEIFTLFLFGQFNCIINFLLSLFLGLFRILQCIIERYFVVDLLSEYLDFVWSLYVQLEKKNRELEFWNNGKWQFLHGQGVRISLVERIDNLGHPVGAVDEVPFGLLVQI